MTEPPYRRIVNRIRERITSGELRPGQRVPSTRQITQEYGVAIATATKALAALRDEGLVEPRAGVGTVVAGTPPPPPTPPHPSAPAERPQRMVRSETDLTRDRIVAAGIRVADAEGLAGLSMRRVAAELGAPTMSLYRHVPGKEELLVHMADAVFGEFPPPDPRPVGWRNELEAAARLWWSAYRTHPWAANVVSLTRPMLAPRGMAHTEWTMQVMADAGLDLQRALYVSVMLATYVMGVAGQLEQEREAEQDSGITSEEWMEEQDPTFAAIVSSGRFPMLAGISADPSADMDLDVVFELGLGVLLDGLDTYLRTHTA